MYDFTADYALKNVWCTPGQDKEARYKPQRLTGKMGTWNTVDVMRVNYRLPEQGVRFHVFSMSQIDPDILGLSSIDGKWVSFADACTNESTMVDIYVSEGLKYPLSQCWYYVTEDKLLMVAVKEQTTIPANLGQEDLYLRFYANAYYNSTRADAATDYVKVEGAVVKDTAAILALQNKFNALTAQGLFVYAFVNGRLVSGIDLFTTQPGDCVEYVYDGSIYRVFDFDLASLKTYTSSMDGNVKYILHPPTPSDTIDYQDDIDVYLYKPAPNNRFNGIYFHRNKEDSFRMITHCDYGVAFPYIDAMMAAQGWSKEDGLKIRLHIRKSGYKRPLVFEANRIHELYKLTSDQIMDAFTGVDSTVSPWRAESLEASAYCGVMRYEGTNLPRELVQDCFGYNALSKLLGNTPLIPRLESGTKVVDVPYGLQTMATAFEFDADGYLIGSHTHYQGSVYGVNNQSAALVEMINGVGGIRLDETYGQRTSALVDGVDYRFYLCQIASGLPDNNWVDVTGTDKYSIANGAVIWNIDTTRYYPMVRGNRNFLSYSLSLDASGGAMRFSLTTEQLRNGLVQNWVMQVPMGDLYIRLNKKELIEGLDYIVKFPEIVILNKKYQDDPMNKPQIVDIVATGFCKSDFTRDTQADVGFVKHGLLSENNRFDLRDDKVQHIVIDGKLYLKSELKFAETDSGVMVDEANGAPYMIRDTVVQMRGLVEDDTYSLRAKAQLVDKAVSDYLSLKLPEPVDTDPNPIGSLYPVYSPFFAKILFDLKTGLIDNSVIQQHYNDVDVTTLCKPYESLLAYDPTQVGNEPDSNYVVIHAHNLFSVVEVNLYQMRFLMRVASLYLRNKFNPTDFLILSA